MKSKRILCLALLSFFAFTLAACAANLDGKSESSRSGNNARILLAFDHTKLAVGETVTVIVQVKNAPLIYGSDVRVTFDPQMLEVVDADASQTGIQFQAGDFIDPEKSFVVQKNVDNEQGTIDYALALLNPAPPVQGKGDLFQVTFRARTIGETVVSIADGMFGTQTGETIEPGLDSVEIRIDAATE